MILINKKNIHLNNLIEILFLNIFKNEGFIYLYIYIYI